MIQVATPFRCPSDDGYPMTVLRPSGVLTLESVGMVRRHTLEALAHRPDLLLFDLSELESGDDLTLMVFCALHSHATDLDVAMALVAPRPALLSALRTMTVARTVAVYASQEKALAALGQRLVSDRTSRVVVPGPRAGVEVRDLVDQCCERWGLGHLADPAALIATELAANVVRHARTEFTFSVTRRQRNLHLTATDHCTDLPRRRTAEETGPGRGLLIIEGTASAWGFEPTSDGKVVWATFKQRRRR